MNRTNNMLIKYILFLFLSAAVTACGGGGGGGSSSSGDSKTSDAGDSTVTTLSGVVADGYLRGARVFLDRNNNRFYDNGEPLTQSETGGRYSLVVNPGEGELYPIVVEVIAGQTVDEDNGNPVADGYLLTSVPGRWQFISPLTTLVKAERDKNPSYSEPQAALQIATRLGIADGGLLFNDYLDSAGLAAAAVQENVRTHKAAQVIAALMGQLRRSIALNLGGQIADNEQTLVSFMVSDQIMARSHVVKQALDDERNLGSAADVTALIDAMKTEIDSSRLDVALLAQYQQRLDQKLDIWDMQAPRIVNRTPVAGGSAPVDVKVSVTLDELMDETLLGNFLIEVSGPNGPVAGQLEFNREDKVLSFVPDQTLLPFSEYQITVDEQLADSLGNRLRADINWSFRTIFDQVPPPLPDI